MSYIGNTSTTQAFTPAVDFFSGTGSATAFTLSRPVASVAQVQVTIDNVAQNPSSAYTVSSNTITFTSAPLSGTNNIYVYYTSPITQVIAPGQGTVGTTALVDASVTTAKLASTTGSGAVVLATSPTLVTPVLGAASATSITVAGSSSLGTASASGNTQIFQAPGSLYLTLNTNGTLSGARRNWAISPEYDVAGGLSFSVGASEGAVPSSPKLIIRQQGAVVLSGGSTSADGVGITFPATINASSDANTLDDYEEGTWTPSVTSQSGSITSYTATGNYTKIGRTVTLYCNIQVTNIGTASGQVFITGVPFNTLSSNQYGGVTRETTATGNIYTPMIAGSQISIQNSTNGGVAWGTNYRYESINIYQTT